MDIYTTSFCIPRNYHALDLDLPSIPSQHHHSLSLNSLEDSPLLSNLSTEILNSPISLTHPSRHRTHSTASVSLPSSTSDYVNSPDVNTGNRERKDSSLRNSISSAHTTLSSLTDPFPSSASISTRATSLHTRNSSSLALTSLKERNSSSIGNSLMEWNEEMQKREKERDERMKELSLEILSQFQCLNSWSRIYNPLSTELLNHENDTVESESFKRGGYQINLSGGYQQVMNSRGFILRESPFQVSSTFYSDTRTENSLNGTMVNSVKPLSKFQEMKF